MQKWMCGNPIPFHDEKHSTNQESSPEADLILKGKKLKALPLESGIRQECPIFISYGQHRTESSSEGIRQEK